ncbi:hypothetical protein Ccar_16425 [Clostridium carboxidivorans P7]|uniref:hypothetical protein n=1 Tax=Clostridium carboxidivorans TaxID=217159 RepID=UPI00064F2380|nr:hypothetical protein [Clostridium carboxidivorans]AKN32362.1 hypothetical protein Ccar_16425 [Clostridium carboxidivorans P7]
MNNVYIIAGTTLGVIGLITLLGYLTYKKVDVPGWIGKIKGFLEGAEDLTNIVEQYNTNNAKIEKASKFTKFLLDQAINAVDGTEQLYVSSQISSDERKKTAKEAVLDVLKTQGIKVTPELENVISIYIEKACGDETIKDVNKKIDELVTSIKKEKEELQLKLQKTESENETLRATVNNITTAASVAKSNTSQI